MSIMRMIVHQRSVFVSMKAEMIAESSGTRCRSRASRARRERRNSRKQVAQAALRGEKARVAKAASSSGGGASQRTFVQTGDLIDRGDETIAIFLSGDQMRCPTPPKPDTATHALLVSLSTHFCHLLARLGAAEPRLDACCCIRLCQARLQP